jgi:hypothetical protein
MENRFRWHEANCIRMLITNSPHVLLGVSACKWMKDWTLVGKLHIHKHAIGRSDKLPPDWTDWYKNSWDEFLRTDPECVRVKAMYDLYIKS